MDRRGLPLGAVVALAVGVVGVVAWPALGQDAGGAGATDTDTADTDAVDTDAPQAEPACEAGQLPTETGCVDLPRLVEVAPGPVRLGSPEDEPYREKDETLRQVDVADPFSIATTEVTRAQFRAVLGDVPGAACGVAEGPDVPVACVSFFEALRFCNALSDLYGLAPAYGLDEVGRPTWDRSADGFRLPTEAEWTLAARAGDATLLAGGDRPEAVAWSRADSEGRAHPVGRKRANGLGLYDLSGNVAEWVWDPWQPAPDEEAGPERVQKGGSWRDGPALLRIAARDLDRPEITDPAVGFRVVRGARSDADAASGEEEGGS